MDRGIALAYCAGFFDGEGCISVEEVRQSEAWCVKNRQNQATYREHRLRCITSQKFSTEPLDLMAATFGGKVHHFADGMSRHLINGRAAVAMLTELAPYLTVKRPQAEIAAAFFDMDRDSRAQAVADVRALKRKVS